MSNSACHANGARHTSRAICGAAMAVGIAIVALAGPSAVAYEVVTVANGGTIDGVVTLSGTVPAEKTIKVTKNEDFCGGSILNPTYRVGAGGGLADVIVYLKDITHGKAAPSEPLSLVNEHCMFSPRAQGAMVGQQIKISSEDTVLHNTHPQNLETNATIFNVALPFKGFSVTKPLPGMPTMIRVKCDAHDWMRAWIMELDNPYYVTTGTDGQFTLKDVPPGTYALMVWHEAAGAQATSVTVAANQTAKSVVILAAK